MSKPLRLANRITRLLINRATRRQRENAASSDADSARNLSSGAPLIFETLEPRLLLAADPLGLVAAYSFDEGTGTTANDSSGQFNTATLTNGVAWVVGQHGNAASFDGVNDYISIPNSASTNIAGNALTLSMWINPQPLAGGDSVIIGKFWNTTMSSPYYQYGLELSGGNRTDFYVGTTSGPRAAIGGAILPFNQWSYLAITFDGAEVKTYVNGALVNTQALSASITARGNPMNIGADASPSQFNKGMLDDLRIYSSALTQSQIQADMVTRVGSTNAELPRPHIDSPANGASLTNIVTVTAHVDSTVAIAGMQFFVDGTPMGVEDTTDPYAFVWDTRAATSGAHTLSARARDINGNVGFSDPVMVNVANDSFFQNEVLATGFNLPTAIKFLPDGRLLVVELAGIIKVLPAPYTTPDPTPFLQLTNIGSAGVQQGIYDIALDPNFSTNHYYYIFYTLGSPNVDRLSRFTANATLTGTIAGSEFVIYQDTENASAEHHGGAINFTNDGKILLTTGEHFNAGEAQDLTKPRGKILRFNMDGTIPTDNPFYDGAGPNFDAIWALGLRNPFRAYYDAPTGRLIIGDVGGNAYSTAIEEVNIGAPGANYGWPNVEAPNGNPAYTAPAYYYPHNGRDASITGGFVYHGTQFPAAYQGSYFFADYTQNWIKRLTFDANGNVTGVFNFEPANGSVDGPYGDIVYLTEGPDGALYYVDLGYSDISGTFGVSKIRRISFVSSDLPPVVQASASPTEGPTPLAVTFSSAGSSDPEGQPLTYLWNFGDGQTSTAANPQHTYNTAGQYQARLTVSDGVNSTLSTPLSIAAGTRPVVSISSPTNGRLFRAGDVISFSGTGTDAEDGVLPASAYTWSIDFLHEGHVHPGIPITGVTSGSFTIPTSGHDFSGVTRYRITLTATDTDGLQSSQSVTLFPDKVNLTFNTTPGGLTLYVDGIAHTEPFVYDTLIGFNHTIEARDQTAGATAYNFVSWSDGGAQQHGIVVPSSNQSYLATFAPASDTTAPSVQITAPSAGATVSGTVTLTANASDNVAVAGVQFLVDNVALGAEDTTAPYSVSWNTTTASTGVHTIVARARDAAGNTATAPVTVTVDNQGPSGTVVINNGAAATNSRNVTLTLSASDSSSGGSAVTQMRFSNNGTSYSAAETYAPTKAWTLTSGAGTKTVYVQFMDAMGNWSAAATDTIVLDTTTPTISVRKATNITGTSATITWTTNEPGSSQVDYGLTTSYGSTTPLDSNLVTSHSVVLTGLASNTTYNFRVRSADAAGNERVSANSTFRTTAAPPDTVPPAVTINQAAGQADPTSASPINFTVTFSETVTGFTASDISFAGSTAGGTLTAAVSGTGPTYNVAVSGMTSTGNVVVRVPAGAATDAAGNVSLASTSTDNTVTFTSIDTIAPAVTINQAAGQADPTSASPINFTVTFSETVTGFTASDISFAGSTAGGTLTAAVSGTGPTYNVAVSGMTSTGNVVVRVPAGAATDAAGNVSLASTSTDNTVAYNAVAPAPIAFVQVNAATPQTNQSAVTVAYTSAQVAGDTNILAIGWNNTTSNITSVTDSAGNTYQLAVPTARGSGLSQAIYYATNIKAAAAGTNTVTVTFNTATPFVDIRALEYSGLDPVNPFDVGTSASGNGTSANSGTITTTAAGELIFGAGMTGGVFSAAGTNFTKRIITAPDGDIAEDRFVTTTGTYSATASLSGSAAWVMQVAAFRAAGQALG